MNIKEKMSNALNISDELLLNVPIISMIGKSELSIENYKGIVFYSEDKIKINTSIGIIEIKGENLTLAKVLIEKISITGGITEVCYAGI